MRDEQMIGLARRLAAAARAETLPRFRGAGSVDDKGGASGFDPVTDADRAAERAMRAMIERERPDHGIAGEEYPDRIAGGPFTWSLDPVDGTRSFICGLPTWTTLIALLREGRPVVGVIDAPVLDELYVGWGGEAWLASGGSEQRIVASNCTDLAEARLSTTDPALFTGAARGAFDGLAARVRTVRYGHDGYAYARLAAGSLDLVIECGLKPFDYNALIPVVRGAGGVIADWEGGEAFEGGKIIAAATPELFEAARTVMKDAA
jgi:histidinol phosphatase-like enzyme (inositol monophosphatase family)